MVEGISDEDIYEILEYDYSQGNMEKPYTNISVEYFNNVLKHVKSIGEKRHFTHVYISQEEIYVL